MVVSLKHAFQSAVSDSGDTTLVQPSNWNAEHTLTLATGRLLGRTSAGAGAAEEISAGTGLSLSGGTLGFSNSAIATFMATPNSANLLAAVSDETGTGSLVFSGSPTLTGTVTATTINATTLTGTTLIAGSTSALGIGVGTGRLQITNAGSSYVWHARYSADAASPVYLFAKSRGTTVNSDVAVATGDTLGDVSFAGYNGAAYTLGARINATVDTSAGISSTSLPAYMRFYTTPDNSTTNVERMRIRSDGNVGIGSSGSTSAAVVISRPITGAATSSGLQMVGSLQPDASTAGWLYRTDASTASNAGTPYTLSSIYHYGANQGTFDADGTVASQMGFISSGTLLGATNNYGFYASNTAAVGAGKTAYGFFSNVQAATGGGTTYGVYASGSAQNYLQNVSVGSNSAASPSINFFSSPTTGFYRATTDVIGISTAATERMRINASGTVILGTGEGTTTPTGNTLRGPQASTAQADTPGGNLTITSGAGTGTGGGGALIFSTAAPGATGTTLNSQTERLRIRPDGNLSFGAGGGNANVAAQFQRTLTGNTTMTGIQANNTISPDVTSLVYNIRSDLATATNSGTPYTVASIRHFNALQSTFHVDSTVTAQYGYVSEGTLIGATNNYGFGAFNTAAVTAGKTAYGFHSAINAATGGGTTYGFYAAGTATNQFQNFTVASGTITTSQPLTLTQTWNNSATTFTGFQINITDTASGGSSNIADFGVGGSQRLTLSKAGFLVAYGATGSPGMGVRVSGDTASRIRMAVDSNNVANLGFGDGTTVDAYISRKGTGNLQLGLADAASAVAQTLSVQSVVAGTSNTAGADLTIQGSRGTGTGAGGSIIFSTAPAGTTGTTQNAVAERLRVGPNGEVGLSGANYGTSGQVLTSSGPGAAPVWSVASAVSSTTYTSGSGTWTKPSSGTIAFIRLWGAGASGGKSGSTSGTAAGGSGGGYKEIWVPLANLGATVSYSVGAGGAAVTTVGTTSSAGNPGGNTTFGSTFIAYGGSSSTSASTASGGGSFWGAATSITSATSPTSVDALNAWDGGYSGMFYSTSTLVNGGNSIMGGGGGGASGGGTTTNYTSNGGTSYYGGNGGNASGVLSTANAGSGTAPGGGGGGKGYNAGGGNSGAGAAGRIEIYVW